MRWTAYLTLAAATMFALPAEAWTAAEQQRAKAGEQVMHQLSVNEGASLEVLFFVKAPLPVARGVLWDHERFPAFMPHTKTTRILEKHGDTHLVEQVGGQGPFNVSFVTERKLEPRRIVWHSIKGDVKRNDGSWTLAPTTGGTLLTYQVHVVPKGPVPNSVTAFLQKQALPNMCEAVRDRIETMARLP
jgi:ribosome-associated toxin RatA of RatAB toxin-antitoxin module